MQSTDPQKTVVVKENSGQIWGVREGLTKTDVIILLINTEFHGVVKQGSNIIRSNYTTSLKLQVPSISVTVKVISFVPEKEVSDVSIVI